MTYVSKFTGAQIDNTVDGRYHSFIQDVHDTLHTSGSPQSITAATAVKYTNNGGTSIEVVSPDYITSRWDTTNNKIAFPDELNTPSYVAEIGFTFEPGTTSEGLATLRLYIDDATPKLIGTYNVTYKGTAEAAKFIATWYLGDATGYDAKNDGVYFELEFEDNGNLYDKTLKIYRT